MATLLDLLAKALILLRWPLLALAVVWGCLAFRPAGQLDFDRSVERLFADDDPLLAPYRRLKRTFGGNEVVLAAYTDPGLLAEDGSGIARLKQISDALAATPGVRDVLSLSVLDEALVDLQPAASMLGMATQGGGIASPDNRLAGRFREIFQGFTHGADGQTAAVVCMLESDELTEQSRRETVDELRAKIQELAGGDVTGEPAMVVDGFRYIEQDALRLGWTSTLLLALIIVVCFRSLRWVVIPIAVVQLALLLTRASLVWAGLQMSMVSSMLTAIVTVVGVATVVHIIVRVRSGQLAGRSLREALTQTIALLAVPVFWACATDAVGFASLTVADVGPVRDFGIMMAVGAMMVLVAVGLLTPGLTLCPPHVKRVRPFTGEGLLDRLLRRSVQWIDRYPVLIAGLLLLVSAVASAGAYRLELETDFTRNFRRTSPIVRAYETVEDRLGGAGVLDVVLPAPAERLNWSYLSRMDVLQQRLREEVRMQVGGKEVPLRALSIVDGVKAAEPRVRSLPSIRRTIAVSGSLAAMETHLPVFYAALYGEDPDSPGKYYYRIMLRAVERQPAEQKEQLIAQVEQICSEEFGSLREEFQDSFAVSDRAEVTGFFVLLTNLISSVVRDQWLTFGVASLGIALTMLIAFRNPLYAAIALVPNALPILTVMGMMGWAGFRINMGAAMIAAVSIGLSVDSSIHYLSSFRLARRSGRSVRQALLDVQQSVGAAVVLSTLALIVGFATLSISQFVPTIYFGVLVSLAMLGGLVGNLVILPVLLRLLIWERTRKPMGDDEPCNGSTSPSSLGTSE